jgi:AAA+ superfamily predicted ATPase
MGIIPDMCNSTPSYEEDMEFEEENATQWESLWGGAAFCASQPTVKNIPAGQYDMQENPMTGQPMFARKNVNLDELIALPDSASEEVIDAVGEFWTKKDKFKELGFLFKRGILLWGPPGSGKTSTVQTIAQNIVDSGGLAMYMNHPHHAIAALENFRSVEPERPIVVMVEDIDAVINNYGEHQILALLDGELNIENVLFIATTNYPERLDARIINRPSRFDIVKLIDMPNAAARTVFLQAKCPRFMDGANKSELKTWVKITSGFSVAHLKEVIISVEGFGYPVEETVERLRNMMTKTPSSEDIAKELGFD